MRERTNAFAVDTVRLCRSIPLSFEGRHVAGQLIRSSTSVAANYRAACRARSRRDFVSKIGIVLEESDESLFWLEFAQKIELLSSEKAGVVTAEAGELLAIFSATSATARQRLKPSKG
ncbi:MAG: four helix bundle protein [Gemmatimonadota bacterium]